MILHWKVVPERFHYFRPAVDLCGETRILYYDPTLERHVSFAERATKEQLDCLLLLYREVLRKRDASDIHKWCQSVQHGTEEEREAAWQIEGILATIERLADEDVSPFCEAPLPPRETAPPVQDEAWRLPTNLEYLVVPALHYGEQYCDELQMLLFFQEASERERDELAALAERVRINRDWPRILRWLNGAASRYVRYSREIDNLFHLMDICDFKFEPE